MGKFINKGFLHCVKRFKMNKALENIINGLNIGKEQCSHVLSTVYNDLKVKMDDNLNLYLNKTVLVINMLLISSMLNAQEPNSPSINSNDIINMFWKYSQENENVSKVEEDDKVIYSLDKLTILNIPNALDWTIQNIYFVDFGSDGPSKGDRLEYSSIFDNKIKDVYFEKSEKDSTSMALVADVGDSNIETLECVDFFEEGNDNNSDTTEVHENLRQVFYDLLELEMNYDF